MTTHDNGAYVKLRSDLIAALEAAQLSDTLMTLDAMVDAAIAVFRAEVERIEVPDYGSGREFYSGFEHALEAIRGLLGAQ